MRKSDYLILFGTLAANALVSYLVASRLSGASPSLPGDSPASSLTNAVVAVQPRESMVDEAYGIYTTARIGRPKRDAVQVGGGVYYLGERCPFGLLIQIRPDALLCESMGRLRIVWRTCDPYLAGSSQGSSAGGQEGLAEGSSSREGG